MRIIARSTLLRWTGRSPVVRRAVEDWHTIAEAATWATPQAVKATFGNVSIVGSDRVVFNINGNAHRLIVRIAYRHQVLFILWFGTHAAYDEIDAATITYKPDLP